jgi:hypothetical protein
VSAPDRRLCRMHGDWFHLGQVHFLLQKLLACNFFIVPKFPAYDTRQRSSWCVGLQRCQVGAIYVSSKPPAVTVPAAAGGPSTLGRGWVSAVLPFATPTDRGHHELFCFTAGNNVTLPMAGHSNPSAKLM